MIKSFSIKDYRQFENVEFNNFSNINLFIGENDTGKTTILKLLYAITYIISINKVRFGSDKLNKLNLKDALDSDFLAIIENTKKEIFNTNNNITFFQYDYKSLFIPAKEILSIMGAINYLKLENIKSGFDDSYTDIIAEIYAPKNRTENTLENILRNYNVYDGEIDIQKETNEFFYKKSNGDSYHIKHTAEGIKKLGIFDILYKTGNIQKNSIIYIDEPENSLHPKMLREFMRFLVDLSKENIQIFMASHNSFVLNQLSNIAQKKDYTINVYNFKKYNNKTIIDGPFDLSKDFPENSITNESYEMFVESKSEL